MGKLHSLAQQTRLAAEQASLMAAKLLPMAIAASLALMASGCVQFADPDARGSLIAYDRPHIPERFHGLWADRLQNCGAVGDRGVQMAIAGQSIGTAHVTAVEGYTDHPAIMVTLDQPDPGQDQLYLDMSLDERWLNIQTGYGRQETRLRRCPANSGNPR
jgi:hypothetical protein